MAPYRTIHDLADMLATAAREGRNAKLTPQTASLLATALRAFAARPTREEVAKAAFCSRQCDEICYPCRGKANVVCRIYEGGEGPFEGLSLVGPPKPRGTAER